MRHFFIITTVLFSVLYYFAPLPEASVNPILVTITTFLFAIFTGFFITRQSQRYSSIREKIALFSGELSNVYRLFPHIGPGVKEKIQKHIVANLDPIVKHNSWDYLVTHKSNLISYLHELIDNERPQLKNSDVSVGPMFVNVYATLGRLQTLRKNFIALGQERMPYSSWIIIYMLAGILLVALTLLLPSEGDFLISVLKASFVVAILAIIQLLHDLDGLRLFSNSVGMQSIKDVLAIIKGEK